MFSHDCSHLFVPVVHYSCGQSFPLFMDMDVSVLRLGLVETMPNLNGGVDVSPERVRSRLCDQSELLKPPPNKSRS